MHTIVVSSLKGGSGKSTIACNLAVTAEKSGAGVVALMDTDSPQGTASYWFNTREASTPLFASKFDVAVDLLIVDTPPQIAPNKILDRADLVLIPVRPSPVDVQAVGSTLQAVQRCGRPYAFIINAVKQNTKIATETLRVLAGVGRVCPITLGDRVNFATSMLKGLAVSEVEPNSRSAEEVQEVWEYVKDQLS